jgi:hypothetical protein
LLDAKRAFPLQIDNNVPWPPITTSTSVDVTDSARDLGVVLDSELTLSAHVSALCRSSYYQLRQLRSAIRSLPIDAAKTIVHAFVSCRLDYCNSLLYGSTETQIRRLQSVQNAAARMVTRARRHDHITPILRDLHWLPVRQRIQYKVTLLVFKSLLGQTPQYLADECRLASTAGRLPLRSADTRTLIVPRSHNTYGDRSFPVAGPRLWNSLPATLRSPDIGLGQFKRILKTLLFDCLIDVVDGRYCNCFE